jgi:hypothetical protein
MENTIRRQASELAETERQMALLRQRLQELGHAPEEIAVTVYEHAESQALEGSAAQPPGEGVGDPPGGSAGAGLQGEAL